MTKTRILVVEDESIVALDIRHRLAGMGYEVAGQAASGEEAVQKARDLLPDLVLMDIKLRGEMDGVEAAGIIRAELQLPVIFLTAFADDPTFQRASLTEAFGYILKPFEERELRINIEIALYKHRLERALRVSEDRYRRLVETSPDAILLTDLELRFQVANAQAAALFGYEGPEAMIGESLLERLPPEERPRVCEHFRRTREDGPGGGEYTLVRKDGSRFAADLRAALSCDEKGRPASLIAVVRDISAYRQAEEEIRGLYAQASEALQRERMLNELAQVVGSTLDLQSILKTVLRLSTELVGAEGALLDLIAENGEEFTLAETYNLNRLTPPATLAPGLGVSWEVFETERGLLLEDYSTHPRAVPELVAAGVRAALGVPVVSKGTRLGVLWLYSFRPGSQFSERAVSLVDAVARQMAVAITNARLFEAERRRAVQLSLLYEVSQQIAATLDEKLILQRTVSALVRHFGFTIAAVNLLVEEDELQVAAIEDRSGLDIRPGYRQKVGMGFNGHVAQTRASYCSNDVSQDPYYFSPAEKKPGSALGAPLLHHDELLGVVVVEQDHPNAFQAQDVFVLETLAAQVATALQNARLYAGVQERLGEMAALQAVSRAVSSTLELDEIFATVVKVLHATFEYRYVSIYLLEGEVLNLRACEGYPEGTAVAQVALTEGVLGRAVLSRRLQYLPDTRLDPDFIADEAGISSEICLPLIVNDHVLGVLNVETGAERRLQARDVELLSTFGQQVTVAIENARLFQQVQQLAITDPLTGLFNRRHFFDLASREYERARRYRRPLGILLWDVDYFKQVNDTHGHVVGDMVLQLIAGRCRETLREVDLMGRYGGEEFVALLPETEHCSLAQAAERLRQAVAEAPFLVRGRVIQLTISVGAAGQDDSCSSLEALLSNADQALLTAKNGGRNRVVVSQER